MTSDFYLEDYRSLDRIVAVLGLFTTYPVPSQRCAKALFLGSKSLIVLPEILAERRALS